MKKQTYRFVLFAIIFSQSIFAFKDSILEAKLPGLQSSLPANWIAWISTHPDSANIVPEGCMRSLYNVCFLNTVDTFYCSTINSSMPGLILCFYDINDSDTLRRAIKRYSPSSYMPPIEYYSTKRYIIITTPLLINGGCFTPKAQSLFNPLDTAIKAYFDGSDVSNVIYIKKCKLFENENKIIVIDLLGRKMILRNNMINRNMFVVKASNTKSEIVIKNKTRKKP